MRTFLIGVVVLGACATDEVTGPGSTSNNLTGPGNADVEWSVQSIGDSELVDGSRITMTFRTDGIVTGQSGCNQFGGAFTTDGTTITIGPVVATEMLCAGGSLMNQEKRFLDLLRGATLLESTLRDDPNLTLDATSGDRITARR